MTTGNSTFDFNQGKQASGHFGLYATPLNPL